MSVERMYFEQIKKLEEENKQLKEKNDVLLKNLTRRSAYHTDIEGQNEGLQEMYFDLKDKLEKIRDLLNLKQSDGYAYVNDYDPVEILNEESK